MNDMNDLAQDLLVQIYRDQVRNQTQLLNRLNAELRDALEEIDARGHRLHCYRNAAVMLADSLELGVPATEIIAQLRALGTHIDRTVAGVLPHVTTPPVAARGSESEAGDEQSIGGGADSSPASGESPRDAVMAAAPATSRPQRVRDALESVLGGGA